MTFISKAEWRCYHLLFPLLALDRVLWVETYARHTFARGILVHWCQAWDRPKRGRKDSALSWCFLAPRRGFSSLPAAQSCRIHSLTRHLWQCCSAPSQQTHQLHAAFTAPSTLWICPPVATGLPTSGFNLGLSLCRMWVSLMCRARGRGQTHLPLKHRALQAAARGHEEMGSGGENLNRDLKVLCGLL